MLLARLIVAALLLPACAGAADYITIDDKVNTSQLIQILGCHGASNAVTYDDTTHAFGCNSLGGGPGGTNTASNLGGGLANYDSASGTDLRFNSFSASDFNLAAHLISIDAANWLRNNALNTGSLQIDSTNNNVADSLGSSGTTIPENQLWSRRTTIPNSGGGANTDLLLQLNHEAEEGGHNNTTGETAGKTTHDALYVYQTQNTPGQSYALNVQEIHAGHGDTVGMFSVTRGTGVTSESGDEGTMATRSETHDYGSTVQGTATFTGGLNPEVLTPGNVSEFESDYVGEGQLIVWVQGGTSITLTGYTPSTRTWTYSGGSATGSTYAGRCVKIDSFDYTDDIGHTAGSWMYIDSGSGGARSFTTQVRQANGSIVGGPIAYNSITFGTPAATVAKACNRVVSMQRDPNGDGNFADTTITIAGANWGMATDFTTNNTEGSCAANCNFEITGEFQQRMHGLKALTSMRKGTLLSSGVVEVQGTGVSTDLKPHWGFVVDGLGAAHATEVGYGCDSGSIDCIEHITATNEADTESFAQIRIKENTGLAGDKFLRIFEPYLDESGGVAAHTAANMNLDLSTDNWSIGPSGSEKRIAVVPTISAASASGNCKTGDLWFRTGTKEIWVCTATNTWTQYP